jgi:type IX secretion system PorP/SprF family membrane protein
MNQKTPIFSGLILLFSLVLAAQQTPHYTQYMYNMQTINPAYVGVSSDLSINLLARSQWVGVEGAPKTTTFSLNGRAFDGLGLGFSVINDKIGLAEINNVNIDASYTVVISDRNRLSLGLKGGASFFNNNLAEGITPDNEIYASTKGSNINVGVGAFFYNERYYIGLSMPYLLKTPQFRIDNSENVTGLSDNINVFTTAGVVFEINDKLKFRPSTLIKYAPNLPLSIDFNANVLYNNRIELGLSYRYHDSASAMIAVVLNKNFRIGYAYDKTLTDLGTNLSSHEVMLMFDLNFKNRGRWLDSPSCSFYNLPRP